MSELAEIEIDGERVPVAVNHPQNTLHIVEKSVYDQPLSNVVTAKCGASFKAGAYYDEDDNLQPLLGGERCSRCFDGVKGGDTDD